MNVALIPARGGSKSIPEKNIKIINGKPLIYWTIKAANECKDIDIVYVATEDIKIRETVQSFNFEKVNVINRSMESASDTAATEIVLLEFSEKYDFDNVVLIQPTSPLLTKNDLKRGFEKMAMENVDSVLSVVEQKRFIWNEDKDGFIKPINYNLAYRPRRQEFSGQFVENGAFYITRREQLLRSKMRVSGNISAVKMSQSTYWEIDEYSDFDIVQMIMQKDANQKKRRSKNDIKLFLTDCDGCLTDGGMYLSENGDELKKFNAKDGKGFQLLKEAGIKTGIITGEKTELIHLRAKKLKIDYLKMGVEDKKAAVETICIEMGIDLDQVVYVGDDINDIEAMKIVGYCCSVANAMECTKIIADYVSPYFGGGGAIRDCIEHLLFSDNEK